jgi:hypothetical protein
VKPSETNPWDGVSKMHPSECEIEEGRGLGKIDQKCFETFTHWIEGDFDFYGISRDPGVCLLFLLLIREEDGTRTKLPAELISPDIKLIMGRANIRSTITMVVLE